MNTPSALAWPDGYRHWTGSIHELAATAAQVLAGLDPEVKAPNERLLRHYQQTGILGRGRKQGNRAVFGFEDLERVVAAKGLVKQNWSLSNAVSLMAAQKSLGTPVSELLYASSPQQHAPSQATASSADAQAVVARLMASSTGLMGSGHAAIRSHACFAAPISSVLRNAATPGPLPLPALPPSMNVQALQLAPWINIYLDEAAARRASPVERQAALDALKAALDFLS